MSKIYTPGFGFVIATGRSVSMTRIGSPICADNSGEAGFTSWAGCQLESLNFGWHQPGISIRASYSSPSYSLLARMGPSAVSFQFSSLTICAVVPSVYSMFNCNSSFGKPKDSVLIGTLERGAKKRPLPRMTPMALSPCLSWPVASKAR